LMARTPIFTVAWDGVGAIRKPVALVLSAIAGYIS